MRKSEDMLPIEFNICPMMCLVIRRVSPPVRHDGDGCSSVSKESSHLSDQTDASSHQGTVY